MKEIRLNRRRLIKWALLSAPGLVVGNALWWEPGWVKTRRLKLAKGGNTHRFVHLTDIHHKGDRAYLEGIVRKINALKPQFVCFTGDIVEDAAHLPESLEILKTIQSPLFGVPGNHDYWSRSDFKVVAAAFAATGGAWLLDESRTVNGGALTIHGSTCTGPIQLKPNSATKNIALIHYPISANELPGVFDLVLAGHSHGGQVRIPFFGPLFLPHGVGKYDLGWFKTPGGPLYVSAGVGWFYANVRFNCRPEIVLFEV